MKRLLLISLLSSMLIGQVSCNAAPITTRSGTDICIAAVAGLAGFIAPALITYYTNASQHIKNCTEKHGIAEKIGMREVQAQDIAWWWSAAAIITGSAIIMHTVKNETISGAAACSTLGALLSIACNCVI